MSLKKELLAIDTDDAYKATQQAGEKTFAMTKANLGKPLEEMRVYRERYPGLHSILRAITEKCLAYDDKERGINAASGASTFCHALIELAELGEMPDLDSAGPKETGSPIRDALAELTPEEVKSLYNKYTEKNQQLYDSGRHDESRAPLGRMSEDWAGLQALPKLVHDYALGELGMPEELAEQRALGAVQVISFLYDIAQTEAMPPLE